jgi:hypothetical protein
MGIKLLNSSPYYAQGNGQAEASNKIMIQIIHKKIDQKPKRWHLVLNEALWAYRMALLTQNMHSAPITQQAEKLSFARAERK